MLRSPYPWRVEEPSIYESVRVHTAVQTGRTENDLVPIAPSVSPFLIPECVFFKKPFITQEAQLYHSSTVMCAPQVPSF